MSGLVFNVSIFSELSVAHNDELEQLLQELRWCGASRRHRLFLVNNVSSSILILVRDGIEPTAKVPVLFGSKSLTVRFGSVRVRSVKQFVFVRSGSFC